MARQRDYAAEYARRQARSQTIYGRGYGAKGGARTRRRLNQILPADVTAKPKPVKVTAGGRNITKTTGAHSARHVKAALEDAAAKGQGVEINVTFRNGNGDPRTRRLDLPAGSGPAAASPPAPDVGAWDYAPQAPLGAVQVTAGSATGVSARMVLRWIHDYYQDDIWDALYDWWYEIYG